jgi:phosphoglycolate phosphatase-like HAD superfamily hydrolase
MIDLVIFDADGVLFDSDESNIAYYNAVFAQMGESPMTPEEERACVYMAATTVFETRARGDSAKVRRMQKLAAGLDFEPFFKLLRPPLELRPFLLGLKQRYRIALATNRSVTVPALIEHLNLTGVFDAVASALDNVAPKPAPDILQLCLERAGTSASRAIYAGDSDIDREAAEAAGTHFIGIGDRVQHHDRVPALSGLPAALEKRFSRVAS